MAFEVFRSWFVGQVTRMQGKAKAVVKVFDESTKTVEIEKLRELSPKAYLPNRALNIQELDRLNNGDPSFKPSRNKPTVDDTPKPKPNPPAPKPQPIPEDKELDRRGPPKVIPDIPKALEDRFNILNQSAHTLNKVSPLGALNWFKACWKWANTAKFKGQLKEPTISLMKMVSARNFRTRGYWAVSKREMVLSPRLLWSDVQVATEIVIHEMCHQATNEISRDFSMDQNGHGPTWRSWMVKAGLNPNRYDHRYNYDTYSNEQDKRQLAPYRWLAENNMVTIKTLDELSGLQPRTQLFMIRPNPKNRKLEVVPVTYLKATKVGEGVTISLRIGMNIVRTTLPVQENGEFHQKSLFRSRTGASVVVPVELLGTFN